MSDSNDKKVDQLRPSSYDGIQEYDNDLPRWWVWLFWLTGVYAVVYVVGWVGFGVQIPPLPHRPIGAEVAAAGQVQPEAAGGASDEVSVLRVMLSDAAAVEKGKALFVSRCAACHGAAGGGLIGPNLTDDNWIHGGSLVEIKKVIENGVVEKGMLAWKAMLSQDDIRAVTVYIRTLKGTNPAGAKGAEGPVYSGAD